MTTAALLMDIMARTDNDEVLAPAADGGILPVTVMGILALAAVIEVLADEGTNMMMGYWHQQW